MTSRSREVLHVLLWTTFVLISVMFSKGCGHLPYVEPPMEIEVRQEVDQVMFRFFIHDTVFFIPVKTQLGVSSLSVKDTAGKTVWSLRLKRDEGPSAAARTVTYGVVPMSFYQEYPANTGAPALEKGAQYEVWSSWGRGAGGRVIFVYEGN